MKKILIVIFFLSFKSFAQDIAFIKKTDTIFLYFDEEIKFEDLHLLMSKNPFDEIYNYQFPDGKSLKFQVLTNARFKKDVLIKRKKFLELNKNRILSIDTIHKYGFYKIAKSLDYPRKIIYILNKSDISRKKLILKKAYVNYLLNIEM